MKVPPIAKLTGRRGKQEILRNKTRSITMIHKQLHIRMQREGNHGVEEKIHLEMKKEQKSNIEL
jgi:hypothetical protein